MSVSQNIGLEWASQAPKNNKNCCSSEKGMFLQFCYFTVDVFFCLLSLMMISHDKLCVLRFSRCTACSCCRVIESLKQLKWLTMKNHLSILTGWLFGRGEQVMWLEEINWLQSEKTFTKLFWFICMLDLCARVCLCLSTTAQILTLLSSITVIDLY